jgi:hypothetical protein
VVFHSGVDSVAGVEAGGDVVRVFVRLRFGGVGGEGFVAPPGGVGLQVRFKLPDAGQWFRGGVAQGLDPADEYPQLLAAVLGEAGSGGLRLRA